MSMLGVIHEDKHNCHLMDEELDAILPAWPQGTSKLLLLHQAMRQWLPPHKLMMIPVTTRVMSERPPSIRSQTKLMSSALVHSLTNSPTTHGMHIGRSRTISAGQGH
ncbi:hypothetical protein J3R82DRAFT_111 [Butyriboletus roseoflavus]|nr:hypothetical protein J3R82DRAFT_111 [Butyriboletus roseoflavus]